MTTWYNAPPLHTQWHMSPPRHGAQLAHREGAHRPYRQKGYEDINEWVCVCVSEVLTASSAAFYARMKPDKHTAGPETPPQARMCSPHWKKNFTMQDATNPQNCTTRLMTPTHSALSSTSNKLKAVPMHLTVSLFLMDQSLYVLLFTVNFRLQKVTDNIYT
jgi:hypothetical protein